MKCEHCGKKEATFYYKSNITGKVTEQHLCSECAKELGYAESVEKEFAAMRSFQRDVFGGFDRAFGALPTFGGSVFAPLERMLDGFDIFYLP